MTITYKPIPTTPAVEIDLSLLIPPGITAAQVEKVMQTTVGGSRLKSLFLFDQYTGPGVPDGYRGLSWRLTFRHPTRTLRDAEVQAFRDGVLSAMDTQLRVRLRDWAPCIVRSS